MKFGIYAIVLLVLATAAFAGAPQCPAATCDSGDAAHAGNPDNECQCFGYDYGIVKVTPGAVDEYGSESDAYTISVIKNTNYDWTAIPGVDGVLVKTGGGDDRYCEQSGGISGSVNGALSVSHITFCGNHDCGDGAITGTEQCEANADCDDSNPFTEDSCNACACEHHQTCTGCECTNTCDPCITNPGSCNGVPEFSPITLLVAVSIAGIGLAYFRKH